MHFNPTSPAGSLALRLGVGVTKSTLEFNFYLYLREHWLGGLPDEARHQGEQDGMRHCGGGEGSGEVQENTRNECIEEHGREKKLGQHGLFSQPKISL